MMIYYSKYYFVSVICHSVIILVETFLLRDLLLLFSTLWQSAFFLPSSSVK